eukprot:363863-Chlamydomonas_euryale.AAC.7
MEARRERQHPCTTRPTREKALQPNAWSVVGCGARLQRRRGCAGQSAVDAATVAARTRILPFQTEELPAWIALSPH